MAFLIERLPDEIQRQIFSLLDYQTLIYLSTMNRYFQRTINPGAMASSADKAQFIMRAARDFRQHRPCLAPDNDRPGNFECYVCFRVLTPDKFDMAQPQSAFADSRGHIVLHRKANIYTDKVVMLRRFCIECGVRKGFHAPLDFLTTQTGKGLWICNCRKVWPRPGPFRCRNCLRYRPLQSRRKLLFE